MLIDYFERLPWRYFGGVSKVVALLKTGCLGSKGVISPLSCVQCMKLGNYYFTSLVQSECFLHRKKDGTVFRINEGAVFLLFRNFVLLAMPDFAMQRSEYF